MYRRRARRANSGMHRLRQPPSTGTATTRASFTPFAVPPGRFTSTFIRTPRYIFLKRRAAELLALLATSAREIMHLAVHARHAYDARLNLTTGCFARFSALSLSSPIRFFPFLLFAGTEGAQWW